jgi:hypothetical protein
MDMPGLRNTVEDGTDLQPTTSAENPLSQAAGTIQPWSTTHNVSSPSEDVLLPVRPRLRRESAPAERAPG